MSFLWPSMLLSLFLVPVIIGIYYNAQQRRKRAEVHFLSFGMARDQSGAPIGRRRYLPPILFLSGLTLLLLALARPEANVTLPRVEGTVILAFDVSGSMAADDLEPTRMDAAKVAAQKFVESQPPGILIGVVVFSDSGFSIQPPTDEQETIMAAINRLSPQRGTSLANGIIASLNVINPNSFQDPEEGASQLPEPTPTPLPSGTFIPATIILLTDGENNMDPDPFAVAQIAADRGVRIHTIGIGSPGGADLTIDNFIIHTELDEETLRHISNITDGTYYNAQNEEELQQIYESIEPEFVIKSEKMEVTSILAGLSMMVLIVGGAFSLIWFGRLP